MSFWHNFHAPFTSFYKKISSIVPLEKRSKIFSYSLVLLATSLDNLNVAGTLTSTFSITNKFIASTTTVSWVFASYSLTLGAFIILTGKLADIFGPHNVFMIGLFFTSIFALIAAVIEKQIVVLIVFRALQGIAASSLIPSAISITGNYFTGEALSKAISCLMISLTAIFGVGLILGGGFSESAIGYKGLYYFTFALGFTLVVLLVLFVVPIEMTDAHMALSAKNLDYSGSFFLVASLLLIILGLIEGGNSWKRKSAYVPLIIGVVILAAVIAFEMIYIQRYKDKAEKLTVVEDEEQGNTTSIADDWRVKIELLFPREVLSIPNFLPYVGATLLLYMAYIANVSMAVYYFEYVELNSPILTAVKVLPISVGLAFGSLVYREKYVYKFGMKYFMLFSPLLALGMAIWNSRVDFRKDHSYWIFQFVGFFLFGYGINLYFQIYWNAIIRGTPLHLQGVVSGILQTNGQIGLCLGNAVLSSVVGEMNYSTDFEDRVRLQHKLKQSMYIAIACCAATFVLLLLVKEPKSINNEESIHTDSINKRDTSDDIEKFDQQ